MCQSTTRPLGGNFFNLPLNYRQICKVRFSKGDPQPTRGYKIARPALNPYLPR